MHIYLINNRYAVADIRVIRTHVFMGLFDSFLVEHFVKKDSSQNLKDYDLIFSFYVYFLTCKIP